MEIEYVGNELELFKNALNWKAYFSEKLSDHIHGDVLEVGSGICANTNFLKNNKVISWTCLEPDSDLIQSVSEKDDNIRFVNGTLDDMGNDQKFDTIVYIDVLEHIEKDSREVMNSFDFLKKGGKLIVLSPSYQYLFSPFDESVGHFRRYNKNTISSLHPTSSPYRCFYLDSVGVILSLANKWILKSGNPTHSQIKFWDKFVVTFSKVLDRMIGYSFGKSIVCIWKREA